MKSLDPLIKSDKKTFIRKKEDVPSQVKSNKMYLTSV